jgi:hypothetical protein
MGKTTTRLELPHLGGVDRGKAQFPSESPQ